MEFSALKYLKSPVSVLRTTPFLFLKKMVVYENFEIVYKIFETVYKIFKNLFTVIFIYFNKF